MAELAVAIVDEELERVLVAELHGEVARLQGDQRPSAFELKAMYSIRRVASEMKKRT